MLWPAMRTHVVCRESLLNSTEFATCSVVTQICKVVQNLGFPFSRTCGSKAVYIRVVFTRARISRERNAIQTMRNG